MAYCDYDFYKNEYLGNVVAEVDFPRLAERASEKIDMLTFERIEEVDGRIVVCNSSGNRLAAGDKLEKRSRKRCVQSRKCTETLKRWKMQTDSL